MTSDFQNQYRSVYIELQERNGRTAFTSGDHIRGNVRVNPTSRPRRITVIFKGRPKLEVIKTRTPYQEQTGRVYDEEVVFFSQTLELFSSASSGPSYDIVNLDAAEDGKMELPFEFKFPDTVPEVPCTAFEETDAFEYRHGYVLPPSYVLDGSFLQAVDLMVEYFVEVQMYAKSKVSPETSMREELFFRPPAPSSNLSLPTDVENVSYTAHHRVCRTPRLDPNYNPYGGMLRRLKHGLTKNSETTPFINLWISAKIPRILSVGDSLPISLHLEYLDRSPEITDLPPIYIHRIRVRLTSEVHVRVRHVGLLFGNGEFHATHRGQTDSFDQKFEGIGELLYDWMLLRDLGCTGLVEIITLAFKSYGIALTYKYIDVRVWKECAKESLGEAVAYLGPVNVLSGTRTAEVVSVGRTEGDGEFAPPPYGA